MIVIYESAGNYHVRTNDDGLTTNDFSYRISSMRFTSLMLALSTMAPPRR